jgi:hypothetical protein
MLAVVTSDSGLASAIGAIGRCPVQPERRAEMMANIKIANRVAVMAMKMALVAVTAFMVLVAFLVGSPK